MKTVAIVAMNQERIIGGSNGGLPWPKISEDFRHFKKQTQGHPVIVGRKTFEEIFKKLNKPLPNRFNIVVSRNTRVCEENKNLTSADSPHDALLKARSKAKELEVDKIFIIGGSSIYEDFIDLVDEIMVTKIQIPLPSGPEFPVFEDSFKLGSIRVQFEAHSLKYQFEHWFRKKS